MGILIQIYAQLYAHNLLTNTHKMAFVLLHALEVGSLTGKIVENVLQAVAAVLSHYSVILLVLDVFYQRTVLLTTTLIITR